MSESKLTIIGFNNYMESMGDDLFKHLIMPDGIDQNALKENIMLRGGEFEVLYSDPYFMQDSIRVWVHKWWRTFEKWVNALNVKYAPLDNYDRYEDYTDTHTGSGSIDTTTTLDNTVTDDATSEGKVNAYDSTSYQPKELTDYDNTTTLDSDGTSNTTTSDSKTIEHHAHLHGNIGVTTSQQMLQAELDVQRFNLIEQITDIFLREYVLPIY